MEPYFKYIFISVLLFAGMQSIAETDKCMVSKCPSLAKIPIQILSWACKERTQWLQEKISSSRPLSQFAVQENVDLILLGETHYTQSCYQYKVVFDNLRKQSGVNCLFLEFNKWAFSQVVLAADENSPVKCFRELVENVQASGVKVFPVDKDGVEEKRDYYLTVAGLNERDQHMTEEILKKKSDCNRSVMIVGKEHVSAYKSGRSTLAERLKKHYQVETINLQNTKGLVPPFEGKEDISWTYNGLCEPPKNQTEGIRVFDTKAAPNYMDLLPGEGSWGDFSRTILLQ